MISSLLFAAQTLCKNFGEPGRQQHTKDAQDSRSNKQHNGTFVIAFDQCAACEGVAKDQWNARSP